MIRDLLVAIDGTPTSRKAEELGIEMAKATGGRLIVVSIVHITSEEERGDQMAQAMEALQAAKQRAHASGVAAEVRVERGNPAEVITRLAQEARVDAIVVGTKSQQGLAHALLGSVAEKVVRTADRTVIVAK